MSLVERGFLIAVGVVVSAFGASCVATFEPPLVLVGSICFGYGVSIALGYAGRSR